MYFFEDIIGKICEKIGVRAFLGFAIIDNGTPEYSSDELFIECERFIRKWRSSDLVNAVVAPHGTYTCGPDSLEKTLELSQKFNVLMHIHCSETRDEVYDVEKKYGERPVHQLKKYNLLNNMMSLAHCGWVTKNEIEIIRKRGAKVCHCPVSNMKIGTGGYAPIPEFIDSKVITSLGTDGAASNNSMDMFDTMKFCALIHKNHRWDPKVLPAQTVLDMATINGARCLNIDSDVGSIEEGKKADLIMIDLRKPHLTPLHDCVSQIVYACRGSDVSTTIINGKIKYDEKEFFNIDSKKIIDQAQQCAKDLTNS
jgi:5-methylthioadenosine/S-adenosylhomocysteine deaminase